MDDDVTTPAEDTGAEEPTTDAPAEEETPTTDTGMGVDAGEVSVEGDDDESSEEESSEEA